MCIAAACLRCSSHHARASSRSDCQSTRSVAPNPELCHFMMYEMTPKDALVELVRVCVWNSPSAYVPVVAVALERPPFWMTRKPSFDSAGRLGKRLQTSE